MKTLLIWCCLAAVAAAEVPVDSSHVVLNHNGVSCGGCSLESYARLHGYRELERLASQHRRLTYRGDLEEIVHQAGLRLWTTARPDPYFLWEVTRQQGAIVSLTPPPNSPHGHIVLLTELNSQYVVFLDSDDGLLHTWPTDAFFARWNGHLLVPIP